MIGLTLAAEIKPSCEHTELCQTHHQDEDLPKLTPVPKRTNPNP